MRRLILAISILAALGFADTLLLEDFNSDWTTASPPAGWRIYFTGAPDQNDWHRQEAGSSPWVTRDSRYAAIFPTLNPGAPPDSLIAPTLDCSMLRNVRLHVTTLFAHLDNTPYQAQLCYTVDGGVTVDTLRDYFGQRVDSVAEVFDLPAAYNQAAVSVFWVFDGDLWDIRWWCIDDVWVEAESIIPWDIQCRRILSPPLTMMPKDTFPQARFRNMGLNQQDSVPVECRLYDEGMNLLQSWSDTIASLVGGGAERVKFLAPPYTFTSGVYNIEFWCFADSDYDRSNDTLRQTFRVTWVENLSYCGSAAASYLDWPVGHYGWGVKFGVPDPRPAYVESLKVCLDCPALPEQSRYQLAVYKPANDGSPGELFWKSPVLTGVDGWNSVFMADTGEQLLVSTDSFYVFYLQVGEPPECPQLGVDGALNAPGKYWEYRRGAFAPATPTGDLMIRASINHDVLPTTSVDVRTLFVDEPWYEFVQRPFDAPIVPKAKLENIGTALTFSPVIATCSIFGTGNVLRYWDALPVDSLDAGEDTVVAFRPWVPLESERCSVVVRNHIDLVPDPDTVLQNNDKRFTVDVLKGAHTGTSTLNYSWIDSDTVGGPVFDWVDTSGANLVIGWGDEQRYFVPIEFDFRYYDSTYNNVYMCSNGWMSFGLDPGTNESLPATLPNTNPPNRGLYPWWDNLAVGPGFGGGRVCYKTDGVFPNRRFIGIWQDMWRVRPDGDTSDLISFEIILNENGTIVFQYQDVTAGDLAFDNGKNACVGLDNSPGTDGLCYLYARPPMSTAVNDLANRLTAGRAIRFNKLFRDAAAMRIIDPADYVFPGNIVPRAKVQNYGTVSDTIKVFFRIRPGTYEESLAVTDLGPGDSLTVTFAPWNATLGTYTAVCSTGMKDDVDSTNDVLSKIVNVSPWIQRTDIPYGTIRRKVKEGTLVYAASTARLYALKGSNTNEFWRFDPATQTWDTLPPMPRDSSGSKAKDGCDLAYDPDHGAAGCLWAIKGGGKPDFYAYDLAADSWHPKPRAMLQRGNYRPPKKGAGIVYVPGVGGDGSVYCLMGNNTDNLYRYDIATNRWTDSVTIGGSKAPILPVPSDPLNHYKRCRSGADIVFDGDSFIYVTRGASSLFIYKYLVARDSWVDTLDNVSLKGTREKRIKDGASMATLNKKLYLLKGGNTQEFWTYSTPLDSWVQLTDIPKAMRGRSMKVKRGSGLEGVDSTLYCLKGSYGFEFWEYKPTADTVGLLGLPLQPGRFGVASLPGLADLETALSAVPNPAVAGLVLSYTLSTPGRVRVRVFDQSGRLVRNLYEGPALAGRHGIRWDGRDNGRHLVSAGVYFAKLETGNLTLTRKLVVRQ